MRLWPDDLRYGLRVLARSPAFLFAALASLIIAVGANTAVFSVAEALLLRPLPYPDADRIGIVWQRSPGLGVAQDWLSTGQYLDVATEATAFEHATAAIGASFNLTGDGDPERVDGVRVTASFFPLFGVQAALGRILTADDDVPGGENVVLLTQAYWQRRYGADPSIVGKSIVLNGNPFTVVGVLSRRFSFDKEMMPAVNAIQRTDLVLPLRLSPSARANRGGEDYNMFVKLKPGVTFSAAQAELDVIAERMKREYPDIYPAGGGLAIDVVPLRTQVVGDVRSALYVLLGSVGFVLLIACSNVASLLLARAAAREPEIAVRVAMGARRSRLVRQLLTESLALSGVGGLCGVGLALLLLRTIRLLGAGTVPLLSGARIDLPVLAFTIAVSIVASLLFGLLPAIRVTSIDPQAALREGGRSAEAGRVLGVRHGRLRQILTAGEIALSVLLLIGAGLLIRSYRRITAANPGFDPRGVLSFRLTLPPARYGTPASVGAFFDQLHARLQALPGVESVGSNYQLPLSTVALAWEPITIEGYVPRSSADERIITSSAYVSPDYFRALRIPVRSGRAFDAHDDMQAPPVVVVDDRLAAKFWPNESALGKRLRQGTDGPWRTVVGVVTNTSEYELMPQPPITTYFPVRQYPIRSRFIVVRADSGRSAAGLMSSARGEIHALDPDLPAYDVETMDRRLADSLARRRLAMSLLTAFAAFALMLSAIGTYGVVAYWVDQRRRELGIRMALGADRRRILRLLGGELLVIVGSGLALGIASALVLTRLLDGMLFRTAATDASTFVGVPLLIGGVAALATYLPSRRATRVDPAVALRRD